MVLETLAKNYVLKCAARLNRKNNAKINMKTKILNMIIYDKQSLNSPRRLVRNTKMRFT